MRLKSILYIMSLTLMTALAKGALAIAPNYANEVAPYIANQLKSGLPLDNLVKSKEALSKEIGIVGHAHASSMVNLNRLAYNPGMVIESNSIGVLAIEGPITKGDFCTYGTNDWTQAIQLADRHPNISAVILRFDTPGGFVSGTQTFADAIKSTRKPVIGFIDDGMVASAGYWLASQCDEIYSSHITNEVGSIGVFVQIADFRKFWEANGVTIREIYSDYSSEKNDVFIKARDGEDKPLKDEFLNPIAKTFISAVKSGRKGKLNLDEGDPFKGKIFMSDQALKIGLIDGIKSFDQVIARANQLSNQIPVV